MDDKGMDDENFPINLSAFDREKWEQRQAFLNEFPTGLAPFTKQNLMTFGFFGGIFGAGLAGIINLRRVGQISSILPLALITLVLFIASPTLVLFILDRLYLDGHVSNFDSLPIFVGISNTVIGMLFAAWIGRRQEQFSQKWQTLSETQKQNWKDQGGCLAAVGWLVLSGVIAWVVYTSIFTPLLPQLLKIFHPSQVIGIEGVQVTIPAGWAQTSPEQLGLDCDSPFFTCLAVVTERMNGDAAYWTLQPNGSPRQSAAGFRFSIQQAYPSAAVPNIESYRAPALNERTAFAFSTSVNNISVVFTAIENGDGDVALSLTCSAIDIPACEMLRDQFVSSLEFAD